MNKLVVDTETFVVEDLNINLITKSNKLILIVKGNNQIRCNLINDLEIIMEDNSNLNISFYNKDIKGIYNTKIIQKNNTNINYSDSFDSFNIVNKNILNEVIGNNNKSKITIRCISYAKEIHLDVLANIKENTKDNDLIEDIKGLNEGGSVEIKPNIGVATSEVSANHYVSISKVSDEDLFYLESKGLSRESSKKLILEGFLKSVINGGDKDE